MSLLRSSLALFVALALSPALADEHEPVNYMLGGDVYAAGNTVDLSNPGVDDVFGAGQRVTMRTTATGSAHLVGRNVRSDGTVGADLYAAGYSVEIAGPVAGDVTAAGYSVRIGAAVGGDLRAAASEVQILAPIGGAAVLAGAHFRLDAPITGDVSIAADSMEFGPEARIDGHLTLYADEDDELTIPASVIPADRITRRDAEAWDSPDMISAFAWGGVLFLLLAIGALALFLAVAPVWSERACEDAADRPARSVGIGFVALATLIGAVPLLGVTVIGAPLVPIAAIFAILTTLFAWSLGLYALGVGVWNRTNRPSPLTYTGRLGLAALGLLIVLVIGLIPFLGWIFCVAVMLLGAGALTAAIARGRGFAKL